MRREYAVAGTVFCGVVGAEHFGREDIFFCCVCGLCAHGCCFVGFAVGVAVVHSELKVQNLMAVVVLSSLLLEGTDRSWQR